MEEIRRRQAKTALLLKLISKSSYFDTKSRKESPNEAAELDHEIRALLVEKVEVLQGVRLRRETAIVRVDEESAVFASERTPEEVLDRPQPRRRLPVEDPSNLGGSEPLLPRSVETVLGAVMNDLPPQVVEAIENGLPEGKQSQILRFLKEGGYLARAGDTRRAPGQKPPVSSRGIEYANIAAANEHSGQVSLSSSQAQDLLSGRETGTNSIDVNLPE